MALPALVLAPLGGLIGSLATKLLDGVINLFTRKFLIHAALIALFVAIYATFMTAINALMAQLNLSNIPQILVDGFRILPSNTDECISIIISAKLVSLAFRIQSNILDIRKA
jgi:hypothetical protein